MDKESQSSPTFTIHLDVVTTEALRRLASERHESPENLIQILIQGALAAVPLAAPKRPLEGAQAAGPALHSHPDQWTLVETWLEQDGDSFIPSFSDVQRRLRFAGTPAIGRAENQKP